MSKAFLFDLDGVLAVTEPMWVEKKAKILPEIFGEDITEKIGPTMGVSLDGIYRLGQEAGATVSWQVFLDAFNAAAMDIYHRAPITEGIDRLAHFLIGQGFAIGIVSASPETWIMEVVNRLSFKNELKCIIPLHDHAQLRQKPHPDGYQEGMRCLGVSPEATIILEDSNTGIASAKAAGAYTIAFGANLPTGYVQQGADAYAKTPDDVIAILSAMDERQKLTSSQNSNSLPGR